jgi:F0F1-type ATP synthase assembly protein I
LRSFDASEPWKQATGAHHDGQEATKRTGDSRRVTDHSRVDLDGRALVAGHDVGVLRLIDKFAVHTDWWAGLICALIGFALAVQGERKARLKKN